MEKLIDLTPLDTPDRKAEIREYQHRLVNEAIADMLSHGYHYWYADCGTGKTLAALELIRKMNRQVDARRVLVLTVKATMRSVWGDDIELLTKGFNVTVLDKGTAAKKIEILKQWKAEQDAIEATTLPEDSAIEVIVVNYETARRLPIDEMGFDLAIADESHRLSSHNSKQSLDLARLCADIPHKLDMTGTAWADHLHQVFGQFRWLTPIIYPNRNKHAGCTLFGHWTDFLESHCHVYTRDNIPIITGYKNPDYLISLVSPRITRVRKDEAVDLPPIQHIKRRFDLSPMLKSHYKQMKKEKTTNINGKDLLAQHDITLKHRLHQLTRGWYVTYPDNIITRMAKPQANVALDATMDLLEEIGDRPTVIFTSYKEDVTILTEQYNKRYKKSVALLTGDTDTHQQFVKGQNNLLIANLAAGSTGVRLHRASYIIFYGLSPSTVRTDYLQSIERVHRHGQTNPVTVYHMVARGTVDEDAYKLLTSKEVLDNTAQGYLE